MSLLAIHVIGKDYALGPIVSAAILVKPDFFRQVSWIKLNSENIKDKNSCVERTLKYVEDYNINEVKPNKILEEGKEISAMKCLFGTLNMIEKFWMHDIYINITEEELDVLISILPENMKRDRKLLNLNKWHIGSTPKIVKLAQRYAEYHMNIQINDIKTIWGDIGTGLIEDEKTKQFIIANPSCPHVRKSFELPIIEGIEHEQERN